eukprot:TRINITY_DN34307_c0_g1_i1.p1 TRINITY_DN34307_c0_g1~~TRINITY_DN34307_c0_g1_i1.p1  ORF type:complete len:445 (-),score=81.96 TRINITY_DN34307_c0_g1_i1:43-1377(-)
MSASSHLASDEKVLIVMVGLPARGKSYISQKVARYLRWRGISAEVFNAGKLRRETPGVPHRSDFFNPDNEEAKKRREGFALEALNQSLFFLENEGNVAFLDATNTTVERRALVTKRAQSRIEDIQIVFLESICSNEEFILRNIKDLKICSGDYENMTEEEAVSDFQRRMKHYNTVYEPVSDDENVPYIKIYDVGKEFKIQKVQGFILSRIVYFIMNIHTMKRNIYLSRHGESQFNMAGKIGGDSYLSHNGRKYANCLADFVEQIPEKNLKLWTSTLVRTRETAEPMSRRLNLQGHQWKALEEINAGTCDGMTYEEIKTELPHVHAARKADKYNYRYERGESYADLVERLEPMLLELERHKEPIFIIGHQAILRVIIAYFMGQDVQEIPYIKMPLHTVIKVQPKDYTFTETRYPLNVPSTGSGSSSGDPEPKEADTSPLIFSSSL